MFSLIKSFLFALYRIYAFAMFRIQKAFLSLGRYNTVEVRLAGPIVEGPPPLIWFAGRRSPGTPLLTVLNLFKTISTDEKAKRVIIRIGVLGMGWSRTQSVARAIAELREADIETIAFLERGGNKEYYLAAQCDRIVTPPSASINLIGLMVEMVFLKDMLDKFDAKADFFTRGKYKNAVEGLLRKTPTKPAKEMTESMVNGLYDQLVEGIATGRGVEKTQAEKWIDEGPFMGEAALAAGLVDEATYYEDLIASLKKDKKLPLKRTKAPRYLRAWSSLDQYRALVENRGAIALVYAQGNIVEGSKERRSSNVISQKLCGELNKIAKDKRVKALVLRINSPGGSAYTSDLIWRTLQKLRKKKPLIVSMGDVAASGGYYIGMAADQVFAEKGTLTGSIGVIVGKFNLKGVYRKMGLVKHQFKKGQRSGIYSDYGPFTDTEKQAIEKMLDDVYGQFVGKAAQARGMEEKELEALAQGRVWLGDQAAENGLVDSIGGLQAALASAKARAGIPEDQPVLIDVHPKPVPMWRQFATGALESAIPATVAEIAEDLSELSALDAGPSYRLPFIFKIH